MADLPVNEIFETVQGEATFTGTPSTFLRLQGCDVGCPWCDTKHTWAMHEQDRTGCLDDILLKRIDSPLWANIPVAVLAKHVLALAPRHVVITGGEPCEHDLMELTRELVYGGRSVQIETSGTAPVRVTAGTWVTVSPKMNMPGGRAVRPDALICANEIKMPVGRLADIEIVLEVERWIDDIYKPSAAPRPPIWLQPLSTSARATALCIDAATQHGWRVSLQVHKFLGLR